MSRKFKILDPCGYSEFKVFDYKQYTIKDNAITCLVGCNGAGKTTLFKQMQQQLDKLDIPYAEHLATKAKDQLSYAAFTLGNMEAIGYFGYSNWASEGEGIARRFQYLAQDLGYYVGTTCKDQSEGWIFLDSLDSGCSIDNIDEIVDFLQNTVMKDKPENLNLHIIIAVNSYAFIDNDYVDCLDVTTGKHVKFNSYEEYRNFIRTTKELKDSRVQYEDEDDEDE